MAGFRQRWNKYETIGIDLDRVFQPLDSAFQAQETMSEDERALDWANNHPDDPRAKKIKERLGAE